MSLGHINFQESGLHSSLIPFYFITMFLNFVYLHLVIVSYNFNESLNFLNFVYLLQVNKQFIYYCFHYVMDDANESYQL